jgi:hypothetical protein
MLISFYITQYLTYSRAIHTYGNRGTTARHARAREHLVIYSGEKVPELLQGESEVVLQKPPIKVTLDPTAKPLRPASRLALAKLHTVEHSVPVSIMGKIAPSDVYRLRQYSAEALGVPVLADLAEDDEEEGEI